MTPFPSLSCSWQRMLSPCFNKALVTTPQPLLLRRLPMLGHVSCNRSWLNGAEALPTLWGGQWGLAAVRQVTTLWEVPVSRPGSRGHYRRKALPQPRRYKVSTDLTRALAKTLPELARTGRFLGQAVLSDGFLKSS